MNDRLPTADDVADLVLRYDGPHDPDQVIEAARTISELVRRVNNATRHAGALRYPPQVDRAIGALHHALNRMEQAFDQIARRLDQFTGDPRVEHDAGADPWDTSAEAADHLRAAAAALRSVTAPLELVTGLTNHLGYRLSAHSPRRAGFPPPATTNAAPSRKSGPDPGTGGVVPPPPHRPAGPTR